MSNHRKGLTILELLVVVGILALAIALVLPAVQVARESARCLQCRNNLRQIGIALHSFHDAHRQLPVGWRRDRQKLAAFGWASQLLSQLECSAIDCQIDFQSAPESQANLLARTQTLHSLLCPSDIAPKFFALYAETQSDDHVMSAPRRAISPSLSFLPVQLPSANYLGVFGTLDPDEYSESRGDGAFMQDRAVRFEDFRRGQSKTFLVGERTSRKLPSTWFGIMLYGEDAAGRVTGFALRGPNHPESDECEFDSRHLGYANFLFADGHVAAIQNSVEQTLYQQMARLR